jgi:hypothetical protein
LNKNSAQNKNSNSNNGFSQAVVPSKTLTNTKNVKRPSPSKNNKNSNKALPKTGALFQLLKLPRIIHSALLPQPSIEIMF